MNCTEFEKIVHELARDDSRETLGEATTVMARFHAETCEACGACLAEARALALALKHFAEESAQMEAPMQMEERLAGAFREHHRSLERAQRVRWRWAEWMALAAAAVVLVVAGWWNFSRGHAGVKPSVVSTVSPATNGTAAAVGTVETAADFDGDFVPVPYGESMSPDDSGLVVRISMTRGALGSLGYPVDEGQAAEVVQADVLVGEDGLPRAVRLVQ
ncbi:MAG TPA: hypothetical protein VKB26_15740 [Candidatus Acidoferrales bacterium]|nr:hypothetical protein [Candidatus Acidoferrales bacterium]